MTLTLEIPEDLIPIFAAMPESERSGLAIAAIRKALSEQESATGISKVPSEIPKVPSDTPKVVEEDNYSPQETG